MYWVPGLTNGRLTTMPKPAGGALLLPALTAWQDAGTDIVVSLLTHSEVDRAQLQQTESLCQEIGLQFYTFPIEDYGIPADETAVNSLISTLSQHLSEGKGIAIHCWGGIGRSTTIAATLLILQGFDPATVFDTIGKARGQQVPDTEAQKQWVWSQL